MTIRHLKTFIAVCDEGGISKAAEKLRVAQPAVSQTVSEMERYYGVTLFERSSRRLSPTREGAELLAKAREAAAAFDEFEELARLSSARAKLKIGATKTVGKLYLPRILRGIKDGLNIEVEAVVGNAATIEEMLAAGRLDFAVVEEGVEGENLVSERVSGDFLAVVCAQNFSAPKSMRLSEIAAFPLLLREKGSAAREFLSSAALVKGVKLKPVVESWDNQALAACAEQGLGLAVLPKKLVAGELSSGRLREIEVTDCDFSRDYCLIYRKNKKFSRAQRAAIELSVREFEDGEKGENGR